MGESVYVYLLTNFHYKINIYKLKKMDNVTKKKESYKM